MGKALNLFKILIFSLLISNCFLIEFLEENKDYNKIVDLIQDKLKNDPLIKHHAWEQLAELVDHYGPRLWGSENYNKAADFFKTVLERDNFENIKLEEVPNAINWVRGEESLIMTKPRTLPVKIPMIGLGGSVGGEETGEVIMFSNFDQMEAKKDLIKDKIVFFNAVFTTYGKTVLYRVNGPSMAAKYGAKACIIRSIASFSIENPHTGATKYDEKYKKIPAAAISLEDADMFARMINRGQTVELTLKMEAKFLEKTTSHNIVAQFTGSTYPEEIFLMGGHFDSWDNGPQVGANDDGGGFIVCYEAIRLLIRLGLRPKRTIRFIAWSGEEFSNEDSGAHAYIKTHKDELSNHIIAFESDAGTRKLDYFGYTGNNNGFTIVNKITNMFLKPKLGLLGVQNNQGEMADTEPLNIQYNIPMMTNIGREKPNEGFYFTYHHSAGDSMKILNPDDVDSNVAGLAALFYILADLPGAEIATAFK